MPFLAGIRACPGESLAKFEIFYSFRDWLEIFDLRKIQVDKSHVWREVLESLCPQNPLLWYLPRADNLINKEMHPSIHFCKSIIIHDMNIDYVLMLSLCTINIFLPYK